GGTALLKWFLISELVHILESDYERSAVSERRWRNGNREFTGSEQLRSERRARACRVQREVPMGELDGLQSAFWTGPTLDQQPRACFNDSRKMASSGHHVHADGLSFDYQPVRRHRRHWRRERGYSDPGESRAGPESATAPQPAHH